MTVKSLSHSSMELYRECPQKFKFRYIDGIKEEPKHYFSFGQSVHKALEFMYRSQLLPPSLGEVLDYYKNHWIREGYKDEAQEKEYFNQGLQILNGYYKKHVRDWKPPLSTEYTFHVTFDGVEVRGVIDRVDRLPSGGLHVIDYKTGKNFAEGRAEEDEQLTLYQVACEASLGERVEQLTLYHLPTLTSADSGRHPETLVRKLRQNILTVRNAIDNGEFDPKPETWKCSRCDYKKLCPAWAGTSPVKGPFPWDASRAASVTAAVAAVPQKAIKPAPLKTPAKDPEYGRHNALSERIDALIEKTEKLCDELRQIKKELDEL